MTIIFNLMFRRFRKIAESDC